MSKKVKGLKRSGLASGSDTCKVLADDNPRRLADGRNAWRKMSATQREEFVGWLYDHGFVEVQCRRTGLDK